MSTSTTGQPEPRRPEPNRLLKGQEVSLGCGTLILIALIVAIFSHGTDINPVMQKLNEVDQKLQRLEKMQHMVEHTGFRLNEVDQKVQRLEKKVDDLSAKLNK